MPERFKIYEVQKVKGRTLFFDANVFLDIFWPTGRKPNTAVLYSRLLSNCLREKIPLTIDFTVLSECVNRALRIEYQKHLDQTEMNSNSLSYKQYRNTPDGMDAQKQIYATIKKNLGTFTIEGKIFEKNEIEAFLDRIPSDFNDCAISEICRCKGFVLVTSDGDYFDEEIDIMSANERLC